MWDPYLCSGQFCIASQCRFLWCLSPGCLNLPLKLKWEVSHEICGGYKPDVLFVFFFFPHFAIRRTEGSFFSVFILRVPFPCVKCCLGLLFCLYFQNPRVIKNFLMVYLILHILRKPCVLT